MTRTRLLLLAGAALAAAVLTVVVSLSGALDQLELHSQDARTRLREHKHPSQYVVVAINDQTFNDLKRSWPFPRRYHAKVIDTVRRDGAKAIGVDIQFTEATDDRDDAALFDAVHRARGKIVLATTEVAKDGSTAIFGGGDALKQSGAKPGYAQVPSDTDGAVRRVHPVTSHLDHFGQAVAKLAGAKPVDRKTMLIDWAGPPKSINTVSYSDVYDGKVPASTFKDKIVVIGPTAPSLQDIHDTGASRSTPMAGAELEANVVRTFVRGGPLHDGGDWLKELFGVLLALVAPAAATRLRAPIALGLGAATALVYAIVAVFAYKEGLVMPLAAPLLGAAFGFVGATGVTAMSAAYDRERVHDLFARFVPAAVVSQVLERAEGARLGGEERVATVMFSDVRGFTTFSEQLPAGTVIEILNEYLGEMTDAILDNGGTLVAFMGDGIFAVFGAPLDQPDHADRALKCARELVGPRLDAFNDRLATRGLDNRFRMGVGLNTGPVVSGNVGSEARLEYAAIGDTTNTAARIEGLTKDHGTMLLFSEATRAALQSDPPDLVDIGDIPIRGRAKPLHLWAVPDPVDASPAPGSASTPASA